MLRIIKAAEKEGHLTETLIEEFLGHAFAMPVLWDCRSWFYKLDSQTIEAHPMLVCHLALLSALAGRLDEAKAYVDILGETPVHFKAENLGDRDFYRMTTELVMPYVDDTMFLRIVYSLVKVGAVPVRSLVLSACRPSLLNGFRDFTRFGPYLSRYKDTISETVHKLYGSGGNGVYEIALAEWQY